MDGKAKRCYEATLNILKHRYPGYSLAEDVTEANYHALRTFARMISAHPVLAAEALAKMSIEPWLTLCQAAKMNLEASLIEVGEKELKYFKSIAGSLEEIAIELGNMSRNIFD